MNKEAVKKELKSLAAMLVASLAFALSLDLFIVPNKIVCGTLTGLSTLVNFLINNALGIGTLTIIFDIPILLLGLKTQGLKFIVRCLITILVLGCMTDLLAFLKPVTNDLLIASIYGGVIQGIAIGIYCKYKVSSGGTELLGRIISEKFRFASIPVCIGILDAIIVITGSIVLQNPQNILYAMIVIFSSTVVSDLVLTGINRAKLCYIISDKSEEISDVLLKNSPRGITGIQGMGMYTRRNKNILMTVVKKHQLEDLKHIVHKIDENAFVIVSDTNEVLGKGFKDIEDKNDDKVRTNDKTYIN